MRILVAGATGAIGRLLVPRLAAAGHEVAGTSRTPEGVERVAGLGARGLRMDALDAESVHAAVTAFEPETVVFQLTALGDKDFAANSRIRSVGTPLLVDAALSAGARRIVAQSISWVYEPGGTPAEETTPLDPDPARAGTMAGIRALEEAAARMPEYVILRYGILYGPGTWYAPGEWIAQQLHAGSLAADDAVTSFCHVADAAAAAVAALEWPSGTVNIVDDEPATGKQWLPVLAGVLGEPAPRSEDGRQGWQRGASNRKAREELGWVPIHPSWREGFAADAG
jgi:nucleoside-diphosphate-sugar epimerase